MRKEYNSYIIVQLLEFNTGVSKSTFSCWKWVFICLVLLFNATYRGDLNLQ